MRACRGGVERIANAKGLRDEGSSYGRRMVRNKKRFSLSRGEGFLFIFVFIFFSQFNLNVTTPCAATNQPRSGRQTPEISVEEPRRRAYDPARNAHVHVHRVQGDLRPGTVVFSRTRTIVGTPPKFLYKTTSCELPAAQLLDV